MVVPEPAIQVGNEQPADEADEGLSEDDANR